MGALRGWGSEAPQCHMGRNRPTDKYRHTDRHTGLSISRGEYTEKKGADCRKDPSIPTLKP